ncbi:MAG TPA: hypothetical protein VKT82_27805 [Ktedonobacterales bacterium]|nr:hypothetical protein [Ktedonobacterales bacterium]
MHDTRLQANIQPAQSIVSPPACTLQHAPPLPAAPHQTTVPGSWPHATNPQQPPHHSACIEKQQPPHCLATTFTLHAPKHLDVTPHTPTSTPPTPPATTTFNPLR